MRCSCGDEQMSQTQRALRAKYGCGALVTLTHCSLDWPSLTIPRVIVNSTVSVTEGVGTLEQLQRVEATSLEHMLFADVCGAEHTDILRPYVITPPPEE